MAKRQRLSFLQRFSKIHSGAGVPLPMPIDTDILRYAESLFDHRLTEEIRPAYASRLRKLKTERPSSGQLPFSGVDAQRLIAVEVQFAKEAALAKAESLATALAKRGLRFDDEAFRKGMEDTKVLLERSSREASRRILANFTWRGTPADRDMAMGIEQDIDAELARVHDSVLGWLKIKLHESIVNSARMNESSNILEDDYRFARMAVDEARKSVSEGDERPRPKVGAVVVKNGKVLSVAHRGEVPGNHAEFVALEKRLSDEALVGATVYTTLEPCTARSPSKTPCAARLVERKVGRVVIGMLDPDPRIRGRGYFFLRNAGIAIGLFPDELKAEVEELNRDFTRYCDLKEKQDALKEHGPRHPSVEVVQSADQLWDALGVCREYWDTTSDAWMYSCAKGSSTILRLVLMPSEPTRFDLDVSHESDLEKAILAVYPRVFHTLNCSAAGGVRGADYYEYRWFHKNLKYEVRWRVTGAGAIASASEMQCKDESGSWSVVDLAQRIVLFCKLSRLWWENMGCKGEGQLFAQLSLQDLKPLRIDKFGSYAPSVDLQYPDFLKIHIFGDALQPPAVQLSAASAEIPLNLVPASEPLLPTITQFLNRLLRGLGYGVDVRKLEDSIKELVGD